MSPFRTLEEDPSESAIDTASLIACAFILVVLSTGASVFIRKMDADAGEAPSVPVVSRERAQQPEQQARGDDADDAMPPLDLAQLERALDPDDANQTPAGDIVDAAHRALDGATDLSEAGRVFSESDLDRRPRLISRIMPLYPSELRRQEVTGRVLVAFEVTPDGRVTDLRIEQSSNNPALDQAALAAVRQWKFEPGRKGGRAVAFRMRAPVVFRP